MIISSVNELKRIAFRNLARHKVKTALSILAITISVAVYIFMDSWLVGMNVESRRNIVSYETGAAKLQTKMYFEKLDDRPMYENFDRWESYVEALEQAGYDAAPRFVFTGTLYSETGSAPVEFNAIDPVLDAKVLRVSSAVESGRYLHSGEFGILLGAMTADKLRTGIPIRPTKFELENEILPTLPESEHAFVRGLYETAAAKSGGIFAPKQVELEEGNTRYILRRNISAEETSRYWALLEESGRMSVRISTVIDIKAAPDSVRQDKYEADLLPLFTAEERSLFENAYTFDELLNAWLLDTEDPGPMEKILQAMVRVDYSGAIRHVNQLISAVVVGIVNAPNPKLNNNTAFIPLDVLQDDAGLMLEGHVTELVIRKHNASDTALPKADESPERIRAGLEALRPLPEDMAVEGWEGYARDYLAASAGDNWTSYIMIGILFILSFLGIANTMLLAILERTREIGMMRAQGMTDSQLLLTLMMEAGMVGLIGSIAGLVIGCLLNIPMVNHGVDFSAMTSSMGGDIGYRVNGVFRSGWNPPVIVLTGIVATVLSAGMAFFPTQRALKMPITESLRFD
ncbi:hypothetical protein FACS1894172_08010 [Spirochaetia bacterium]|nr:hypothetical protein FACS1894164_19250 [Spirochaetia bacterium]GHU32056.1 hypothetical protein FACS1894172_08010 [Spirochaetia bacterium]